MAVKCKTLFSSQVHLGWKPHTLKTPEIGPPRQRGHENWDDWRRERVCEYIWGGQGS